MNGDTQAQMILSINRYETLGDIPKLILAHEHSIQTLCREKARILELLNPPPCPVWQIEFVTHIEGVLGAVHVRGKVFNNTDNIGIFDEAVIYSIWLRGIDIFKVVHQSIIDDLADKAIDFAQEQYKAQIIEAKIADAEAFA